VPRELSLRLKKVYEKAAESGVLAGYPVVDFKSHALRWIVP